MFQEIHKQWPISLLVIIKKLNFLVAGGLERGYNTVFTGGETVNKVSKILKYYDNFSLVIDDSVLEE